MCGSAGCAQNPWRRLIQLFISIACLEISLVESQRFIFPTKPRFVQHAINFPLPPVARPTPTPRPSEGTIVVTSAATRVSTDGVTPVLVSVPSTLYPNSASEVIIELTVPSTNQTVVEMTLSDDSACKLRHNKLTFQHDERRKTNAVLCYHVTSAPFIISASKQSGINNYDRWDSDAIVVGVEGHIRLRKMDGTPLDSVVVGSQTQLQVALSEPSVGVTQLGVGTNSSEGSCLFAQSFQKPVPTSQEGGPLLVLRSAYSGVVLLTCEDGQLNCSSVWMRCTQPSQGAALLVKQGGGVNSYSKLAHLVAVKAGVSLSLDSCHGLPSNKTPPRLCGGGIPAAVGQGVPLKLRLLLPRPASLETVIRIGRESSEGNCSFSGDGESYETAVDLVPGAGKTVISPVYLLCTKVSVTGTHLLVEDATSLGRRDIPGLSTHIRVGIQMDYYSAS